MTQNTIWDPVDALLARHGVRGPWTTLPSTGVANRIYATSTVVLRVATDHPDAIPDARTESVAAPLARAAGILTPRLMAFDDSRTLTNRPFSLWERVQGETVGLARIGRAARENLWHEVGQQIVHLHSSIRSCTDPNAFLDTPGRELNLEPALRRLAVSGHQSSKTLAHTEWLIDQLRPSVENAAASDCFVHNDLHEMNIMCDRDGALRAILDWGDAGWGDPALDFAAVPLDFIAVALDGYGPENVERLGRYPKARFIWDRLHNAIEDAAEDPRVVIPIADYREFLERQM